VLRERDDTSIISLTKDISTGGLFLVNTGNLQVGEQVKVILSTPSTWEPLCLVAEVCWSEHIAAEELPGVGIRFATLSDEQLIALSNFVSTLEFEG
jgi:Tfp pilus assembly protein PilZ